MSEQFFLSWRNFHMNMSFGITSLLEKEDFVDVTLAVDGRYLKAHKMVLSVCSSYFKELFKTTPCKHPIVFMKDVSYHVMSDLLQFMYQGEVRVSQESFTTFMKTAESLQIEGLKGLFNYSNSEPTTHYAAEEPESEEIVATNKLKIEHMPIVNIKKDKEITDDANEDFWRMEGDETQILSDRQELTSTNIEKTAEKSEDRDESDTIDTFNNVMINDRFQFISQGEVNQENFTTFIAESSQIRGQDKDSTELNNQENSESQNSTNSYHTPLKRQRLTEPPPISATVKSESEETTCNQVKKEHLPIVELKPKAEEIEATNRLKIEQSSSYNFSNNPCVDDRGDFWLLEERNETLTDINSNVPLEGEESSDFEVAAALPETTKDIFYNVAMSEMLQFVWQGETSDEVRIKTEPFDRESSPILYICDDSCVDEVIADEEEDFGMAEADESQTDGSGNVLLETRVLKISSPCG